MSRSDFHPRRRPTMTETIVVWVLILITLAGMAWALNTAYGI